MTGRELMRFIIDNQLEDAHLIIGCEGYTATDNKAKEQEINLYVLSLNRFMIADNCAYEEVGVC